MPTTISYVSNGRALDAELHSPSGAGPHGLVVLAYGTDGFTDDLNGPWKTMIRGYAEDLAGMGFLAMIPDYFKQTGTAPGEPAMLVMAQALPVWASAITATVAHAKTLSQVNPTRIGLLGFSLGGHLCLRVRAAAAPKALVSFFAPIFDGIGPAGSVPNAELHHGKADRLPATGIQNIDMIEKTLTAEHTQVTAHKYDGAGHGFIGEDPSNKSARTLSKNRVLTFFGANL
jgi:dienelactone hydrolase